MRHKSLISIISLSCVGALVAATALADGYGGGYGGSSRFRDRDTYRIPLRGFEEAPVIVTGASGELRLTVNEAAGTIAFQLGFDGLEGDFTQAHIHVGQPNVGGGVSVWLCQSATNAAPAAAAATTPTCSGRSGNVSGTLTAVNVVGPANQGVGPGEFADFVMALRAGKTYGNVHSTFATGGEIRGQIVR